MPIRRISAIPATLVIAACTLAGCATAPAGSPGASSAGAAATAPAARGTRALASTGTAASATANLAGASGSLVSGRLALMPMAGGVHLTGEIGGLVANSTHAIHIHERGDCSAADASSAGGHFNPTNEAHGRAGQPPHHRGDLDNVRADGSGVARIDVHASGVVLGGGAANDIVGKAVVVHAKPDDYRSQPAGDAGDRIACAVITAGR